MEVKSLKKRYVRNTNMSTLLLIINNCAGLVPLFIVMLVIKAYNDGTLVISHFYTYSVVIFAVQLIKPVTYALFIHATHKNAFDSLINIRMDIINHLKKLPISFFQHRKTGELTNIINHDVEQVEIYIAHGLPEIMSTSILPVTAFISILIVDYRLALCSILGIPIGMLGMAIFNKLWAKEFSVFHGKVAKMSEDVLEYIASISLVKAFSNEETRTSKVIHGINNYFSWVRKMTSHVSIPMASIRFLSDTGILFVSMLGSFLLFNGNITREAFIISLIFTNILCASFNKISTFHHVQIMFNKTMSSIHSILGEKITTTPTSKIDINSYDLKLDDVTFYYEDDSPVLKNITAVFKEKTLTAIVGASGSGKSTIANLLLGFYKNYEGSITLGSHDYQQISEADINRYIAIMQQESFLFNLSIEDNLRIGKKEATHEEIVYASKQACIHEMITSLPEGYQTKVGELGSKLSGGEKQRLSIARMILKDSPILILDEATSSIDPYNEYLIQKAIDNLRKEKTVIVIAHHLKTIVDAEQILVMNEGSITDKGTHNELLEHSKLYRKMIQEQEKVDAWEIKQVKSPIERRESHEHSKLFN